MLGYDISWAGFNIIEVMSSAKFTYKRIGYLAGSQSFHADTEVRSTLHKFKKEPSICTILFYHNNLIFLCVLAMSNKLESNKCIN